MINFLLPNLLIPCAGVDNTNSRLVALDLEGNELWRSTSLQGVGAGTPQITSDGRHVALTHNIDLVEERREMGLFSIFDQGGRLDDPPDKDVSEEPQDAAKPPLLSPILTEGGALYPFSPLGGQPAPTTIPTSDVTTSEGEEQQQNLNDVFVWAMAQGKYEHPESIGFVYSFQFPANYDPDANKKDTVLQYHVVRDNVRPWQSDTMPVMTTNRSHGAESLYWVVLTPTTTEVLVWEDAASFAEDPTATLELAQEQKSSPSDESATKAIPLRHLPSPVLLMKPTDMDGLDSDSSSPNNVQALYGAGPSNQFYRISPDGTESTVITTDSIVLSKPVVSNNHVYYATTGGRFVQADLQTLDTVWSVMRNTPIQGDLAMNAAGTMVFAASVEGGVIAIRIEEREALSSEEEEVMQGSDFEDMINLEMVIVEEETADIVTAYNAELPQNVTNEDEIVFEEQQEGSCFSNLTEIYFDSASKGPDDAATYVICPDTVYEIGTIVDTRLEGGMAPLLLRSNRVYQCGATGSAENNCVFRFGRFQVISDPNIFAAGGEPAQNVSVRGVTFDAAEEAAISLDNAGSITFHDCVVQNQVNDGGPVVVFYEPRAARRLEAADSPEALGNPWQRMFTLFEENANRFHQPHLISMDAAADVYYGEASYHDIHSTDNNSTRHVNRDLQTASQSIAFEKCIFRDNALPEDPSFSNLGVVTVITEYNDLVFRECLFENNQYDDLGNDVSLCSRSHLNKSVSQYDLTYFSSDALPHLFFVDIAVHQLRNLKLWIKH